ncbi:sigma 54-interacting transcriptional regulator [Glaciimonas sp. CA11.2]|uniref:sigma-54-dependent Fis family transcriptional regulator n=1 Tax=unclassified Glaciimonas TaxID=2644401 RepID=UPI002AB361CC|nr:MULTISPECIES: sigma 54-interacting transcriptional regulator [unclassified Glaciimonas]MDY7545309.1 sigma 54-interacting transcriptional regulator [Glaciimonas sp. CA11.2]MEB0013820.1 sigma 54-interacting transcriptional regulator [Glaciimonas sp. Cout2]MEB0083077.1 sigma 54-interacting transcriptional regulator [Glaciimonas sp. Gout2]MEB0162546.1 sigma 54-interacting transcriptional regulator [Glaciimonas sp. CA11.2]
MPTQTVTVSSNTGLSKTTSYRSLDELCGGDPQMQELIMRGKLLIDKGIPILILGETGTGKEYLSRALHAYSARRKGNLIAVNCASIPESLAESELFGYCKGAFSGALPGGMKGKVQQADGGTLFLDEIGDMPFSLQTRLLRVLSEHEVIPLGAAHPVSVDIHLICATHQDLKTLIAQGRFREDLYYRIAGGVLRLPTLRARADKKQLIMQMIADELSLDQIDQMSPINSSGYLSCKAERIMSPVALQQMMAYSWPGNLRQMHAVVRYCCAVMSNNRIEASDLPEDLMQLQDLPVSHSVNHSNTVHQAFPPSRLSPSRTFNVPLRDERSRVIDALVGSRWNISAASRQLGMCRASLYRKLRELEIPHVRDQAMPAYAT